MAANKRETGYRINKYYSYVESKSTGIWLVDHRQVRALKMLTKNIYAGRNAPTPAITFLMFRL